MTPHWLMVVIYVIIGLNVIFVLPKEIATIYGAIKSLWRKRQQRKYDEAVQTLIDNMREICTPSFFPHLHRMILKNAYGDGLEECKQHYSTQIEEGRARALARNDWRDPASAKAWGAIYQREGKPGAHIHVQAANGHVIMDTTEWHMLQEIRRDWCKSPLGFAYTYGLDKAVESGCWNVPSQMLMSEWEPEEIEGLKHYSLKGVAAQYLAEMMVPTIDLLRYSSTIFPRYEVINNLDGTVWIWNSGRGHWTVE